MISRAAKNAKRLLMFFVLVVAQSCGDDRIAISPSNDVNELKKFISLEKYAPSNVTWTYSKIGIASDRTPGPTDFSLKAELAFPSDVVERIKEDYNTLSITLQPFFLDNYTFDWLSAKQKTEIKKGSFVNYKPIFFTKGSLIYGGFIVLNDSTVLLSLYTM